MRWAPTGLKLNPESIFYFFQSFNETTIGEIIRAATIFECKLLLESCLGYFRNRKMYYSPQTIPPPPQELPKSPNSKVNHVQVHSVIRLAQPAAPEPSQTQPPDGEMDEQGIVTNRYGAGNNSNNKLRKYCNECKKGFATVGSYTRHLRMIHYKLKPLSCHVCHHAFYQRSDLKKHIQRQHPDEPQQSP